MTYKVNAAFVSLDAGVCASTWTVGGKWVVHHTARDYDSCFFCSKGTLLSLSDSLRSAGTFLKEHGGPCGDYCHYGVCSMNLLGCSQVSSDVECKSDSYV
jgi:hypothetical protein